MSPATTYCRLSTNLVVIIVKMNRGNKWSMIMRWGCEATIIMEGTRGAVM